MKKSQTENQSRDSYQTGSTVPPKNYQGLIAVLLIVVIFLGGIVSVLSMMNIRLFRMLEDQNTAQSSPVQFYRHTDSIPDSVRDGLEMPALGLTGQEVTELCRSYYGWPEGLYICAITPDGPAEKADLRQGDILVELDGVAMDSEADLATAIAKKNTGDSLLITVFRNGSHITIPLTLE